MMVCIGAVNVSLLLLSGQSVSMFSCLSLVMRGRRVELWIGLFFDVWPWRFFAWLDGWVFRAILALSAICR